MSVKSEELRSTEVKHEVRSAENCKNESENVRNGTKELDKQNKGGRASLFRDQI